MDKTIKGVFDGECSRLEIGPKLIARLHQYQVGFVNKNEDHINFFGGNLLGVQVVRFTPTDHDRWFDEIVEVDNVPLQEQLLALPTVNPEERGLKSAFISSDAFNLSCVWLAHAISDSKHLTPAQKEQGMIDAMLVLQYKFLTSLLYHYFHYPTDTATAEATYAQLSNKFAIKQYGSWMALLRARAEAIIAKNSIHFQTILKMDDDNDVTYMLNDTQGRIRDTVKNIYAVFDQVHKQGIRISSVSSIIEHDGVEILKDRSKNLLAYGRYINEVIADKNSFVREELTGIIEKLMYTMPPRLFHMTLGWMSDNYRAPGTHVEEMLTETLVHSFDYLADHRSLVNNSSDLPGLLTKLRGVYMSSRSTDPALFSLRNKAEKIVRQATGNKNNSIIASVRTGVLLYIVLRSFTMRHYTASA